MNLNQNPFSLYDFLGYFIPGALLLYMLSYINWPESALAILQSVEAQLNNDNYLLFIIVSYIVGHFVSFLSSITVEKYAIWVYGYPSKYLLNIKHDGFFNKSHPTTKMAKRVIIAIFLLPITVLYLFLDWLLNFSILKGRPLDQSVISLIEQHARKAVDKMDIENTQLAFDTKNEDFFTILYHYVLERNRNHYSKIQNYVALYGFLRCITLIFVLLFWVLIFAIDRIPVSTILYIIILASISFISYVFFLAFKKFYRRYSQETLLALTTMKH